MNCPKCGKPLDPARHGDLVCDGQVWCDGCHAYARQLLQPREFSEIQAWGRRICEAFGYAPVDLVTGDPPPPPGPFDFLEDQKLLMAEADHREGCIILYPAGCRLTTLCHELAHLITNPDHTREWAETFARLVAWVKERLPEDHYTKGIYVNLLKSSDTG